MGVLTTVADVDNGHGGVGRSLLCQKNGRELVSGNALKRGDARHGAFEVENSW